MSNRYRDSMDRLHFTQEQKQEMVDRLMEAGPVSSVRPLLRFRRFAAVGAAAALALSLGVAGATGALGSAGGRLCRPVRRRPRRDGDYRPDRLPHRGQRHQQRRHHHRRRHHGGHLLLRHRLLHPPGRRFPLVSDETLAAGAERDGLLPLRFRNYGTQVRTSGGGAHGSSWFYDADPADNAIQFVEMMTQDQPLKPGTASVKFQDLSVYTDNDYRTSETLAEGTWRLKFDFSFEDSSISLPAGQSFTLNGMDATLDGVTLSPLSIQVDYTVHQELAWSEDRESGQINAHDREQSYRYFESLPVVITYTDGTTQDLTNAGGGITPGDGETVCQKSRIFDELRPLDEVASVTVGDIVLPVSAG